MKDALGHGSDSHGAHSEGIDKVGASKFASVKEARAAMYKSHATIEQMSGTVRRNPTQQRTLMAAYSHMSKAQQFIMQKTGKVPVTSPATTTSGFAARARGRLQMGSRWRENNK